MNETELKELVEEMVQKMLKNEMTVEHKSEKPLQADSGDIKDISKVDIKTQYLVSEPYNKEAFLQMKQKTPARIGIGKAGARYKTATMLRVRADHAAAQDSVFSDVSEEFINQNSYVFVQTLCSSKDEYLTRPDKGRRFSENQLQIINSTIPKNTKVAIVVGDGLSSAAIEANAAEFIPSVKQSLKVNGIDIGKILFVKYCRVGAMDDIGEATDAELICLLVGERPGLVTAESMSAYITYKPRHGIPEAKRTVISNIHRGGTPPVEAGAHAAELIIKMLQKKASGIDLKNEVKQ